MVDLCGTLIESAKKIGRYLYTEKIQYIKVSRELGNILLTETIIMGPYEIKIEQFIYLGIIVT